MPIYRIDRFENGSLIAVWEMTETEKELLPLYSGSKQELQTVSNPFRRLEHLAVRIVLQQMLGTNININYRDNRSPYLQNHSAHISISHTKRFACVYYHPLSPVGIDIESLSRNFSAVTAKALSEKEREYLLENQEIKQVCIIWCAKEAVFKLMNQSGIDFAKQIAVEKFKPEEKGKLAAIFTSKEGEITALNLYYRIVDDHAMVWVEA